VSAAVEIGNILVVPTLVISGGDEIQKVTSLKNGARTLGVGSDDPSGSPISKLGQISEIGAKRTAQSVGNPQGTTGFPLWQHFQLTLFLLLRVLWKVNGSVQNEEGQVCVLSELFIFKTLGVIV
jgi:hypothetical protein